MIFACGIYGSHPHRSGGWASASSAKPEIMTAPAGMHFGGGSRHRMSTRTRTKTSPSEWSMLGGAAPAPERSAAPRWEGQAFSLMVRQRHEQGNIGDSSRRSPRRGEPRIARPPEDRFIVRWRNASSERQRKLSRLGVQPNQYGVVGDSQPPEWRPYGA